MKNLRRFRQIFLALTNALLTACGGGGGGQSSGNNSNSATAAIDAMVVDTNTNKLTIFGGGNANWFPRCGALAKTESYESPGMARAA